MRFKVLDELFLTLGTAQDTYSELGQCEHEKQYDFLLFLCCICIYIVDVLKNYSY